MGSRVSLSPPSLISVESANIVAGRYAYTKDLLQLDRFTDASNPPLWSVPPSPLCLANWTEFIAAHPDQEYASYVQTGLLSGFRHPHGIIHQPVRMRARSGAILQLREKLGVWWAPYASQTSPESTLVQSAWFPNLSRTNGG